MSIPESKLTYIEKANREALSSNSIALHTTYRNKFSKVGTQGSPHDDDGWMDGSSSTVVLVSQKQESGDKSDKKGQSIMGSSLLAARGRSRDGWERWIMILLLVVTEEEFVRVAVPLFFTVCCSRGYLFT